MKISHDSQFLIQLSYSFARQAMWGSSVQFYEDEKTPESADDYLKIADDAYAYLMGLYDGGTSKKA